MEKYVKDIAERKSTILHRFADGPEMEVPFSWEPAWSYAHQVVWEGWGYKVDKCFYKCLDDTEWIPCCLDNEEVDLPNCSNLYADMASIILHGIHMDKSFGLNTMFVAALYEYLMCEGGMLWGHDPKIWPKDVLKLLPLAPPDTKNWRWINIILVDEILSVCENL